MTKRDPIDELRLRAAAPRLLEALRFYADRNHFILSDDSAWDTVSGEPQNFWCDEAGTATVEDGSIARAAIAAATEGAAPAAPLANFCESCAMDLATCDCVNPRPVYVDRRPADPLPEPVTCDWPVCNPGCEESGRDRHCMCQPAKDSIAAQRAAPAQPAQERPALTAEQLDILRHTIGLRQGRTKVDRNHFVTGEGSTDHPICMSLVEAGLMMRIRGGPLSGGDDIFRATEAGKEAAKP